MKHKVLFLVAAIFLFAAIGGAVYFHLLLERLGDPQSLARLLSEKIGCPVEVSSARADVRGSLVLTVASMYEPLTKDKKKPVRVIEAPKINLSFDLWQMILHPSAQAVRGIEFEEPTVSLSPPVIKSLAEVWSSQRGEEALPAIEVKRGVLNFSSERTGLLVFKDVTGTVRIKGGAVELDLISGGEKKGEHYALKGTASRHSPPDLGFQVEGVELARWASVLLPDVSSRISGTTDLAGTITGKETTLQGKLRIRDGALKKWRFPEFSADLSYCNENLRLSNAALKMERGAFAGKLDLARKKKGYSGTLDGNVQGIPLENLAGVIGDFPLEGLAEGTLHLGFSDKGFESSGSISLPDGRFSSGPRFKNLRGEFDWKGEKISIRKASVDLPEGKISFEGTVANRALFLNLRSDSFKPAPGNRSEGLSFPQPGSASGTLRGTPPDLSFSGSAFFPLVIIAGRELRALSLSGDVNLNPRRITFSRTTVSLGRDTFPFSGYMEKEKDGWMKIHLGHPAPELVCLFLGAEGKDLLSIIADADLRIRAAKGKTEGKVLLGKGAVKDWGFKKLEIDFIVEKKGTASFNGALLPESGERIGFQGTSLEGKVHLVASSPQFSWKEAILAQPRLELTYQDRRASGNIKAAQITSSPETLKRAQFSFTWNPDGILSFKGDGEWKENQVKIDGTMQQEDMETKLSAERFRLGDLSLGKGKVEGLSGEAYLVLKYQRIKDVGTADISISSTTLAWRGKNLPPLTASLSWKNGEVLVKSLVLPQMKPPLSMTGSYIPTESRLILRGELKGHSLASLAELSGAKTYGLEGGLTGAMKLEGTARDLLFSFQGKAAGLAYKGKSLGEGDLSLKGGGAEVRGSFEPSSPSAIAGLLGTEGGFSDILKGGWEKMTLDFVRSSDGPLSFSGKATHQEMGAVDLKGTYSEGVDVEVRSDRLRLEEISLEQPTLRFSSHGEKKGGTIEAPRVQAMGLSFQDADLKFEEADRGVISYSGGFAINESPALVSGTLQGKKVTFRLASSRLRLKGLSLPGGFIGNLGGTAEVEIKGTKEGQASSFDASLKSSDLEWEGRKLPRVSASISGKGDFYDVRSLEVYSGDVPLRLSGKANAKVRTISLEGSLQGNSISSIMKLLGSSSRRSTGQLEGTLAGPVTVEGPIKNVAFSFRGRVHDLVYQNRLLGNGTLKISGDADSLKGRLDLDQIPGGRIRLPIPGPAGSVIRDVTAAMKPYFVISGSPKNPQVSMQVEFFGGAEGARAGPQLIRDILNLFQSVPR